MNLPGERRQGLDANEILKELIEDYTKIQQEKMIDLKRGLVTQEQFLSHVRQTMETYYDAERDIQDKAMKLFEDYIFGYYIIESLIRDQDISDIKIVAWNNIRIKEKGKRKKSNISFVSEEEYLHFVEFIATKNMVNVSNTNATQTFTDTESNLDFILRFSLCMPLLTTHKKPYVQIRKIPKNFPQIANLIETGMMSEKTANYLVTRFKDGSVFICGKGGAGKTYLLNALKETVEEDKAVLIIQQNEELTNKYHPETVCLHPLINKGEGKVQYTLRDLAILGLTMDVDYFIIGEVKGSEALHLLNASYTGHICAATGHGPDATSALNKVVDNAMGESTYKREELLKMLTTFKTIVFLKDFKVAEISEVLGFDEERKEIIYKKIL